jgi:anti-anti-sigma factor
MWSGETAVIAMRGELDRSAAFAIEYAIRQAARRAGRVVLDLTEVAHLDYGSVPGLVDLRNSLVARGGELTVVAKTRYLRNVLQAACGQDLPIVASVAEARAPAPVLATARARR